jgi:hypothetical protein
VGVKMKKNHIFKILTISICYLFIGVTVSSATSDNNLLKIRDKIEKIKNLNDEIISQDLEIDNFKVFEDIKNLLDKPFTNKIFLLLALNFFILYWYFLRENNQEWAQYSFNMSVFCMVMYFLA